MLTKEENERITRVGPGTPCGALLRRYWQPVALAADLTPERPKLRVRVLGEELVVFRDEQGDYGCLAERCAHRGASLYYGFVEDCGIRCPYHGWKYATADGQCLEQPFEPAGSTYKDRVRQRAYPVQRLAGLLFVYMGPQPAPLLPRWDVCVREDGTRKIQIQPPLRCNWLQAQENTADTVHTYYLHGHMLKLMGRNDGAYFYRPIVKYDWDRCEWGITKICHYGGEHPEIEIRPPLVFPNILRIPQGFDECLHWRVPIDDTTTRIFIMVFTPNKDGQRVEQPDAPPVEAVDQYLADGEFDLSNFYGQDRMAWETQGPLYDRSQEHLGATDRGIVLFRQLLAEQITVVEQGGEPMALVRDPAQNDVIAFESRSNAPEAVATWSKLLDDRTASSPTGTPVG
ncbi:MAG TPA: aromatic ring-hydroxylating dioxygenase subunit alpha [Chloroflexota bacterium]|jgi:5,5'-dehydrodivanillate O-demethylase